MVSPGATEYPDQLHAKDVYDIGVSWNLDNPTKPDIIFTQTAIKKVSLGIYLMGLRLTRKEIEERTIAWNEAVAALQFWATNQAPSQQKEAEKVWKTIDRMADKWFAINKELKV